MLEITNTTNMDIPVLRKYVVGIWTLRTKVLVMVLVVTTGTCDATAAVALGIATGKMTTQVMGTTTVTTFVTTGHMRAITYHAMSGIWVVAISKAR